MALTDERAPRVFISYSHDSEEHAAQVLTLAFRLRGDGVDAVIDQALTSPAEGWPAWMDAHIRDDDFVVMVCSDTYYRRVVRQEAPHVGLGVAWEGSLIYNQLYRTKGDLSRFVPVLLEGGLPEHVPDPVFGGTHYRANTASGYEGLLRRIFHRPIAVLPPVGSRPALPAVQPRWSGRLPDVDSGPDLRPARTDTMDSNSLLDRLNQLLPAQFEELVFRLGIPPQHLTYPAPLGTRAIEVLRYLRQEDRLGELERLIGGSSVAPARSTGALRILFLGVNPADAKRCALGCEVTEIGRSLRESDVGRSIDLVQDWALRPTDLHAILLRHRPQVVHFSGRGSRNGALCFEDDQAVGQPVAAGMLGRLFAVLGREVRCVVLNVCYSEIQACALCEHVGCVIGMKDAIPDSAAISFASSFYLALAHGEDVATALALGRNQIELALACGGSPVAEIDLPVLVARPGVDAAQIRLVDRSAARR